MCRATAPPTADAPTTDPAAAPTPAAGSAPARAPAAGPPALGAPGGGGGAIGSILPSSENIQIPSPRLPFANTPPPACTTTYCCPLCSNVVTVVFTPASVMNSHSFAPVLLSSAVKRPSARPTNNRPPAVTTDPL